MNKQKTNHPLLRSQKWWETSRNPDPKKALAEELKELLDEARWWRKTFWNSPNWSPTEDKGYTSEEDVQNFWRKWSDGCHYWHSQKKRWYAILKDHV